MLKRDGGFSSELMMLQQFAQASSKADFRRILRGKRRLRAFPQGQVVSSEVAAPHPQGQVVSPGSAHTPPQGQVVSEVVATGADASSTNRSPFICRPQQDEQKGLLNSWQNACLFYGLPPGQVIPALFSPTATEPDVTLIIQNTPQSLLPVLIENERMLPEPAWGISRHGQGMTQPHPRWPRQPEKSIKGSAHAALSQAQVILVPALAIDEDGVRLGQGGGWYDRALAGVADEVPVIAAIFDDELLPGGMLPMEPHDRCVDAVITPTQFIPLS